MLIIFFILSVMLVAFSTGAACWLWAMFIQDHYRITAASDVTKDNYWSALALTLIGWVVICGAVAIGLHFSFLAFA